jgi:Fe-S oxidoreductase
MSAPPSDKKEGNLAPPTRHPVEWRSQEFYDRDAFLKEAERIFDICHGCRRCVSLCNAFPTLFDLVDDSKTMEVDGVAKGDFWKVVDQCYLCDVCYMTKCPYVPPHPVERRLPAHDAARQGDPVQGRGDRASATGS